MSNLLNRICKIRDILELKQYDRLGYIRQLSTKIFDEVHIQISRKSKDYNYKLDFTAQDLRETARAITDTFKRWDNEMCPDKNIKKIKKEIKDGKIYIDKFMENKLAFMRYRRDYTQVLIELRSLLEYHSVYLYFLEYAANDEFAIKCTERL